MVCTKFCIVLLFLVIKESGWMMNCEYCNEVKILCVAVKARYCTNKKHDHDGKDEEQQ